MATPTVRELLRGTANNVNITLTTGAGTAVGDVLVVLHAADGLTAADLVSPTGTAGTWTQQALGDIGASNAHVKCWTRPVTVAGAQTVTATKVGSTDHGVHLYVLAGADTSSPVDGATGTTGAASTSHVAPSISPATADALLLCAVVAEVFSFGNYTAVSGGMTDLTEDDLIPASTFSTMVSARQALTASGATGARTFTYSQSKVFAAVSVAVKAAGGGGGVTVNGTAAAAFTFTATAAGVRVVLGAAAAPLALTVAASGTIPGVVVKATSVAAVAGAVVSAAVLTARRTSRSEVTHG